MDDLFVSTFKFQLRNGEDLIQIEPAFFCTIRQLGSHGWPFCTLDWVLMVLVDPSVGVSICNRPLCSQSRCHRKTLGKHLIQLNSIIDNYKMFSEFMLVGLWMAKTQLHVREKYVRSSDVHIFLTSIGFCSTGNYFPKKELCSSFCSYTCTCKPYAFHFAQLSEPRCTLDWVNWLIQRWGFHLETFCVGTSSGIEWYTLW